LLTVALFITGSLLGLLLFMITESSFVINVDRAQFYLPLTAFMFLGGTLLINGLRKGNIFLEQQANQQRQNAIRSLAGSIAHEMRNPLG
jgi:signal transduction histidine kinase